MLKSRVHFALHNGACETICERFEHSILRDLTFYSTNGTLVTRKTCFGA
jgi:hypothetical protein